MATRWGESGFGNGATDLVACQEICRLTDGEDSRFAWFARRNSEIGELLSMSHQGSYGVVIIGPGHNRLACAGYLARKRIDPAREGADLGAFAAIG